MLVCVWHRTVQFERADDEPDEWRKVSLALDDGAVLRFTDVRKFGRFTFTTDLARTLGPLGPEPLCEDFTVEWLAAALKAGRRMLKPLLLDQSCLAGLGNIYVDDSLHCADLHVLVRSERLRRPRVERRNAIVASGGTVSSTARCGPSPLAAGGSPAR